VCVKFGAGGKTLMPKTVGGLIGGSEGRDFFSWYNSPTLAYTASFFRFLDTN
jgi:hypothetical protein